MTSDMVLEMGKDKKCSLLCKKSIAVDELERSKEIIGNGFQVEWIVDNLPGATTWIQDSEERKFYSSGFPLGFTVDELEPQYYLNNHFTIVIRHRKAPGRAGARGEMLIVGFEIYPRSLGPGYKRGDDGCPIDLGSEGEIVDGGGFELFMPNDETKATGEENFVDPDDDGLGGSVEDDDDQTSLEISYTYSVYFKEDETIEWSNRWDRYLEKPDTAYVHSLAIVNSLIICGMLTGVVLIILARTVRSDIKSYKDSSMEGGKLRKKAKSKSSGPTGLLGQETEGDDEYLSEDDGEALEDVTGWKLLHADVFRAPIQVSILAPLVGCGTQLLFMSFGLVLLSAAGVLNPSFRGGFISVGIALFVTGGVMAGYFSGRVYRAYGGTEEFRNALMTEGILPAVVVPVVLLQDVVVWANGSSTAIPFTTLLALVVLWAGVQIPLVHAGNWYAFHRSSVWEHPTKTASTPRQIPTQQPWYLRTVPSIILAGLIPFAVIFIELLYIFQSLWQDKSHYYYAFGFLIIVASILLLTVAEVSVVATYVRLGSEDHTWPWRAFTAGASSAAWVFAYSVWYYFGKMGGGQRGLLDGWLFFAYSATGCAVYAVGMGAVGFLASYAFVRRIYG